LLIEDSPLIRKHLVALLEDSAGISVTGEVDTEAAAIAALDSTVFDAAVVDLQLREGSGFGVLQHLQAQHPDLLAIVLTNSNTPAMRAAALRSAHTTFSTSRANSTVWPNCSTALR
jgi:two-component system OmpR family response regulator